MTKIPGADGFPAVPRRQDDMFTSHYGVHLQGKILTERSIDIGNLWLRTHNFVVVHSLQTWADADAFRRNLDAAWAKAHGGEKLADHLAKTVFPLANNYWETTLPPHRDGTAPRCSAHQGRGRGRTGSGAAPATDGMVQGVLRSTGRQAR